MVEMITKYHMLGTCTVTRSDVKVSHKRELQTW